MADPSGLRSRESLAALLRIFIKTLVGIAAVFVLVRIISPDLMDIHSDLAFWAGLLCWPLALVVAVGAVIWIARDIRGLGASRLLPQRLPAERD
jgi:hypothetical protein